MIVFISGGARSGKSDVAERTALSLFHDCKDAKENSSLYYIATAKKTDLEMEKRIQLHQQGRGNEWKTIEEPYELSSFLTSCKKNDVILIDCLTIWLSQVLFEKELSTDSIKRAVADWLKLAARQQFHVIIVSNDVNEELLPKDEGVLTYIYTLQQLHQQIADQAEQVIQVVAGLPEYWKGGER
ncbi:bifunctional adenosylcobinamide kinase/adenosylcobinamide-phosphate guanylyltransferase [Salsuginibacillus kocurii]|uniref:bifunctional adenosylcobinamide kinase/adenosylcobinamide-phosphate guanylyltransferase n=1 Tax=Salsuginibacillus kocurii TaxID=427078 RepID=UPI00035F0DCB|nr:bifunctional adenosylcobinamide kinase/adenosylcobinamide-phosphate guanylyltransferase [Salsuginibacillus kocurii]